MKKILCFDIDGVICKTKGKNYKKSIPIKKNIQKINELYAKGYYIKIFTARYMGRSKENISLAKKRGFHFTRKQLNSWLLDYHELLFGKPTFDLFVDDKSIFFKKNWIKNIKKYL